MSASSKNIEMLLNFLRNVQTCTNVIFGNFINFVKGNLLVNIELHNEILELKSLFLIFKKDFRN